MYRLYAPIASQTHRLADCDLCFSQDDRQRVSTLSRSWQYRLDCRLPFIRPITQVHFRPLANGRHPVARRSLSLPRLAPLPTKAHRPVWQSFLAILAFALLIAGTLSGSCAAQDAAAFRASAVEPTERQAVMEAYFQGIRTELSKLAGAQAQTDMGSDLRAEMERNFDSFRQKYFTPDTDYKCGPQNGRVICEVEGSVLVGALSTVVRNSIRTTEQTLSNSLTFAVTAANSKDSSTPLVIDKLTGAFASSGYKLLAGSAINQAIEKSQIDYSLAIQEVSFGPATYIAGERRAEENLTVRFVMLDVRRKLQVAVVPVVVAASVSGPSLEPILAELHGALADKAANEIARQANNSIVSTQQERAADQAALQRNARGQVLFLVQLEGVTQRDRDRIREARDALSRAAPGAQVQVDPQKSSDTQVTIAVTGSNNLAIDDLIDALYAMHPDSKSFEAVSNGIKQIRVRY